MIDDYLRVMKLIQSGELDYAEIALRFASRHPVLFLECADARGLWRDEVARMLRDGTEPIAGARLKGIKLYREENNSSLREAKTAVDEFIAEEGRAA